VNRVWIAALGEEMRHEPDLPACCRRSARGSEDSFDCPSCGAVWQAPLPVEPEECAFMESEERRDRKGAA
jgi:DNA-binding helix-hairpin-helix protein with protein kinase domain